MSKFFSFIANSRLLVSIFFITTIFIGCGGKGLEDISGSSDISESQSTLIFGSIFNLDENHVGRNVKIQVNPGFTSTKSDENGNFFFDNLQKGVYTLIASSGNYITSTSISTISTDFLNVDMKFGTNNKNTNDINFFQNDSLVGKKINDDSTIPIYSTLLDFLPINFAYIDSIDWSPTTQNLLLLSASEIPLSNTNFRLDIYLFNLDTKELKLLVKDTINNQSASDPTFSPLGNKFSYLQNNNIFYASIINAVTNPFKLIRNESLLFKTPNGHLFLKLDFLNEEAGIVFNDTQTPATQVPTSNGFNPSNSQSADFFNNLNTYFNGLCANNLNNFSFCQDVTIQACRNIPLATTQTPSIICPNFYPQNQNIIGQTNASSLFDATNFPADCPAEFKSPVWSPKGNAVAFLAKPKGCTNTRPLVCGRACDDTNYEVFVSFIDYKRDGIFGQTDYYSLDDFQQLDKFSVMQLTQNNLEEINISWDPLGHSVLYDQITNFNQIKKYFLIASSPTDRGLFSRTLLVNDDIPHQAHINANGSKIAYISKLTSKTNPFGFPQIVIGDFNGTISNTHSTTLFNTVNNLRQPKFYRIFPKQFKP
ncbi:MAG: hypothetical protein COB02_05595 [Candidatus Cloacimonadota bacterium]|nr:MAG: hypothetical protein COB02_05595 [Candidatus Cloacimonadota bacterium]